VNSLDLSPWVGHGWLLLLVFTVTVLLAGVLRKSCRRLFGTERAFQLWLLPPLAMLASQLPHAAVLADAGRQPAVFEYAAAAIGLPSHMAHASSMDWRASVILLWLSGMMVSLLLGIVVQGRYRARLHGATPVDAEFSSRRVLRATRADVGPALVGAWRPCIVLPADFEQRYDTAEQRLILAHEDMHARRGDGWWCLLARTVAALFWFHPLAWWALSALRHDQELACDAAVLREHGAQRRSYANAMLKTQSAAIALPVGCPWSPRHPVTERIEMLKNPLPKPVHRVAGLISLVALLGGTSAAVYAAQRVPAGVRASPEAVQEAMVLFDGSKTAVAAYLLSQDWQVPADNDVAGLPPPDLLSGKFVRRVSVRDGVITADLRARPNGVATAGSVRLIPRTDRAAKTVRWRCESGDIVNIQALEAACRFNAAVSEVAQSGAAAEASGSGGTASGAKEYQFNMSLQLLTDDTGAAHARRATLALCADVGKTAQFRVHDFDVSVLAIPDGADRVIMNLDAGGSGGQGKYLAVRRMGMLGQVLHLEGNVGAGKGHFTLDVTPQAGCPARAAKQAGDTSQI
jgi:beta-lactamase regulating signal transducer with metallopeptidase domain